ncbi:hypothetical protein ATANTOWER_009461 [Ataeniobius toweri]|uniref:Uncharacterized protein n=1 Tax=Ataeniobius toweri TaxID=208326 RepID=A0ABU7BP58_9TELE|nr:hypothetical protein [Ataeniobius toweri]
MDVATPLSQSCTKVELNIKEEEAEDHHSYGPSDIISIPAMCPSSVPNYLQFCFVDGASTCSTLSSPCSQQDQRYSWAWKAGKRMTEIKESDFM